VRKGFHEVRDVHNIADILIDPEGARPWRDHWEKSAHSLLTGAILHVLYAEEEKTLSRVAAFLADPARSIRRTMWVMLTTNHLGTESNPKAHPTVASAARELLNKTDNERSGVVSTAMTLLGLCRDPIVARMTSGSDWRIADLLGAERPVSLYLVVPPSDTPNDERTAKRLSDTLGTSTQLRAQRNLSGRRLSAWLSHMTVSEQETPRPLLTPGEILQLPASDALVMVSGRPPIRAGKLRYYADHNFLARRLAAPALVPDRYHDAPPPRADDWSGTRSAVHPKLHKAWSEMVSAEEDPPRTRERVRERPPGSIRFATVARKIGGRE
jgi:type IV secretory pathway TraG/TraD family ATPase VirD4